MSVSVAAQARLSERSATRPWAIYLAALTFWVITRWLVLVHQGAWPWMNAFVVAAARGIVVGDWNEAVRPQLPAVLGVPLVLAGATEQQMVAALYLVASLVQFAAFVALVRTVFPARYQEQTLALLVFLLVPFNHSIHHYRDMPVVLASAAIFLLAAHFIRLHSSSSLLRASSLTKRKDEASRGPSREEENASHKRHLRVTKQELLDFAAICVVMLLGIWSRIEMLTFVGILCAVSLIVLRRDALREVMLYGGAAVLVTASLLVVYKLENVDLSQAWFYTAHTFLDSTPDSWLSPECQANPTENCREADGLGYFGPANLRAGVFALALNRPLMTLAKSARSGWDNAWVLLGSNLSTFPGVAPFVVLALALARPARELFGQTPASVWVVAAAIAAESVLPPLTWAPPHPQYHIALVAPIVLMCVPVLVALLRMPRARLVAFGFLIAEAALSAFRYTRYAGY